jgi:hypothetical protein
MKTLTFLLFSFLVFAGSLPAQPDVNTELVTLAPSSGDSDTTEIPQGVIRVRKANIIPYVKVEYKYYLSRASKVKVNVPVDNGVVGYVETKEVTVFDSSVYSRRLQRVYPRERDLLLSKLYVENMTYRYSGDDTARVDTMVIGMWIDNRGRVKEVLDDPEYTLNMPDQMAKELERISHSVVSWGDPGGYYQAKRRFKKAPLILESYYVEVFIIVSSYPLTQEQKLTRYSPFDYPLNSPPLDEQQKASREKNGTVPKR